MQYLIAFIITFIFSYLSAGAIRKKPLPFYITGALISTAEQVSEDVTTTGSRAKRKRATTTSKTASRSDESNKESEAETASADAAAETAAPSGVEKTETEAASSTAQRETKAATTARSAPAQTERSAAKTPARTAAAPPEYKYNNGTYTAKAYGYDGYIHVTLTIENDIITSFSAYTEEESEEDQAYFNMAYGPVGQAIVSSSSSDVDGVSGATISSDAIKMAAKKCLKQALK